MRIPTFKSIVNPRRIIRGVATQAAGVVAFTAVQKFVPWLWVRWASYFVLGAAGLWFPLAKAVLYVTKLDQKINNL